MLVYNQIKKIRNDFPKSSIIFPSLETKLIDELESIYRNGIISAADLGKILKDSIKNITVIYPNRHTQKISVSSLYTPKSAYQKILLLAPEIIRSYNLNSYLKENLRYDSATSEIARNELLNELSLTSGMIQSGQRIIDRGEIVTSAKYQILKSLKIELDNRREAVKVSVFSLIGEILIVTALITLLLLYVYLFRPRIYGKNSELIFIILIILVIVAMAAFAVRQPVLNYYMVPYALIPIVVRVFFDSRTALFTHMITVMIVSLMVDNPFQFLIIQMAVGMATVSSLKNMSQRSQLAHLALYTFLIYTAMYVSLSFISEGDISKISLEPVIYFGISSVLLLLAYVLIYVFEKLFGLISDITLVELTNINSDLLMRFSEVAPGTFQHSLQVSNLATEAAKKIGANSLLVRTGALYHDIGKMVHPECFIENQANGNNPLLEVDLEKAASLVISHVTDGEAIARKYHLPEQIIHFIATHHGTNKTKYFYNSYINSHPDKIPNVDAYTYPGPLPSSKESAILMMADAVEARSRSMNDFSEESINEMVETMIDGLIADGQFKNAPISFRDVEEVKAIFKEKMKNVYHTRIVYPDIKKH